MSSHSSRHVLGRIPVATIAIVAAVALSIGLLPSAFAQEAQDVPQANVDLGDLGDLLENELILDYVEVCTPQDGAAPAPDADATPVAVADCSQSTGDGLAIVLPENIELGQAAENVTIDLGDDIKVLGYTFRLGERNLFEVLSAAALGSNTIKDIAETVGLPRIDPLKLGAYTSYEQVRQDAALPYKPAYRDERGKCKRKVFGICVEWETHRVEYDGNLAKRTDALKIASYLTGETYDPEHPVELPDTASAGPRGNSTIIGDGTQVAAAMRGGDATAEGHQFLGLPGIAVAAADEERSSIAYSRLGFSAAANMGSDEIGLTWFGQAVDFSELRDAGIVDFAGEELEDILNTAEDLEVPAIKEVSCYGLFARGQADGLGTCANILGTFDSYRDLRPDEPGESRQTQVGITDVTSLVLGNDALAQQLTGETEETPFLDDLMDNLTSEDDRLKFAKDFARLTTDVYTAEDGSQTTGVWLTSDYGLRDPVTVEWLGHRVVFFPGVEVNGEERPNLIGLPELERITDEADQGLLPKVSLVAWDNAFGLGSVELHDLTDPAGIAVNWWNSVTLGDDILWINEQLN